MSSNPTALKRPYTITQHGFTRTDEYYWMREREDPEVFQNTYAQKMNIWKKCWDILFHFESNSFRK